MVTYDDFVKYYLVKNGMPVTETNLNKAPDELKKEIDEFISNLGTIDDFLNALG